MIIEQSKTTTIVALNFKYYNYQLSHRIQMIIDIGF
jgi:hypothetical protein